MLFMQHLGLMMETVRDGNIMQPFDGCYTRRLPLACLHPKPVSSCLQVRLSDRNPVFVHKWKSFCPLKPLGWTLLLFFIFHIKSFSWKEHVLHRYPLFTTGHHVSCGLFSRCPRKLILLKLKWVRSLILITVMYLPDRDSFDFFCCFLFLSPFCHLHSLLSSCT